MQPARWVDGRRQGDRKCGVRPRAYLANRHTPVGRCPGTICTAATFGPLSQAPKEVTNLVAIQQPFGDNSGILSVTNLLILPAHVFWRESYKLEITSLLTASSWVVGMNEFNLRVKWPGQLYFAECMWSCPFSYFMGFLGLLREISLLSGNCPLFKTIRFWKTFGGTK